MNNPTIWDNIFHFSNHQNKQIEEKELQLFNPPASSLGTSKKRWPLTQRSRVFFCWRCKETYGITEPWFEPLETVVNVTRNSYLNGRKKTAWKDATKRCWLWENGGLELEKGRTKMLEAALGSWFFGEGKCDMWSSVFWRGFRVWNVMNYDYLKSTSISLKRMACSDQIHPISSSLGSDIDLWIDDFGALQSALGMDGCSHVSCFQGLLQHLFSRTYRVLSYLNQFHLWKMFSFNVYFRSICWLSLLFLFCSEVLFGAELSLAVLHLTHTNWIFFSPWWPLWMSSLCFPSWSSNWCVLAYRHLLFFPSKGDVS